MTKMIGVRAPLEMEEQMRKKAADLDTSVSELGKVMFADALAREQKRPYLGTLIPRVVQSEPVVKTVQARIPDEVYEALKADAEKNGTTVSDLLRKLIQDRQERNSK